MDKQLQKLTLSDNSSWSPMKKRQHAQDEVDSGQCKQRKVVLEYESGGGKFFLHGYNFQLKWAILLLHRGCQKDYSFMLATEMKQAEKFDDLVFRYKNNAGLETYKLLQFKHQMKGKIDKITASDLQNSNGDYSLSKYFDSFRKMKQSNEFRDGVIEELIICTNRDFNFDSLQKEGIKTIKVDINNHILNVEKPSAQCYAFEKFPSKVMKELQLVSTFHQLAAELAQCLLEDKKLDLTSSLFKKYHYAMVAEIIDAHSKKLQDNFIQNHNSLSHAANDFYTAFDEMGKKLHPEFWKIVTNKTFKMSMTFGKGNFDCEKNLPADRVDDVEIEEYRNKLLFAVNQPNEGDLGAIIKSELGDEFNLTNSNIVFDQLHRWMWAWMSGRCGYFLTSEDGKDFLDNIRQKLRQWKLTGVISENLEKKLQHKNFFRDVNAIKAISTWAGNVHVLSESTALTFIKVAQMLQNHPSDDYAVLHVRHLLSLEEHVLTAFLMKKSYLLVVEIMPFSNKEEEVQIKTMFDKLIEKTEDNKRIVLISVKNQEDFCLSVLRGQIFRYTDTSCYEDLTAVAQHRILDKVVQLQGTDVKLQTLVPSLARVFSRETQRDVINNIISEGFLRIGNHLVNLDAMKSYYVKRKFELCLKFTIECLTDISETDLFVISGAHKQELEGLSIGQKICEFDNAAYKSNRETKGIIVLSDGSDDTALESQITEIRRKFSGRNVHWLHKKGNYFFAKFPGGTGTQSENQLFSDQIKIIVGVPGIGKSTILISLLEREKRNHPSFWAIRIPLVAFTKLLDEMHFTSVDMVMTFLYHVEKLDETCVFERQLLYHSVTVSGQVIILLDGFDEICPSYKERVIELVQLLKTTKVRKLWITSRPHFQNELVDTLAVYACYTLLPFSLEDQASFMKNYWFHVFRNRKIAVQQERLEVFLKHLLQSFANSTNDRIRDFIGIPLQAKMLAEIYRKNCEDFLDSEYSTPDLPQTMDILELYVKFIDDKYSIYYEDKAKMDLSNPRIKRYRERDQQRFPKLHSHLAFSTLFPNEPVEHLVNEQILDEDVEELISIGIVQQQNNELGFIHRTFAEYFVARLLFTNLSTKRNEEFHDGPGYKYIISFLTNWYFDENSDMIRVFLDHMLAKDLETHHVTLAQNGAKIQELIIENPGKLFSRDLLGRCPVHLAVSYCTSKFLDIMLEYVASGDVQRCIATVDDLQFAPICYAVAIPHNGSSSTRRVDIMSRLMQLSQENEMFNQTVKPILKITTQRKTDWNGILQDLYRLFDRKQFDVMLTGIDYVQIVLQNKDNFQNVKYIFDFASPDQQHQLLRVNNYEFLKHALCNSSSGVFSWIADNMDDMQEEFLSLQEFHSSFENSLRQNDYNAVLALTRMLGSVRNFDKRRELWKTVNYRERFQWFVKHHQTDLIKEFVLKLFGDEDLFGTTECVDYFKQLFVTENEIQKVHRDEFAKLFQHINKPCTRKEILLAVGYTMTFREAFIKGELRPLMALRFCTEPEKLEMTRSFTTDECVRVFQRHITTANHNIIRVLLSYISVEEKVKVTTALQCKLPKSWLFFLFVHDNDNRIPKLLEELCLYSDISQDWTIWGHLLYLLLKYKMYE